MGREFGADVNGRRAVARPDNCDGHRVQFIKANGESQEQREKDTELARRPKQNNLGVFQQRLEIGHRADAKKNQQGKYFGAYAHIVEEAKKSFLPHHVGQRDIYENGAKPDGHKKERLVPFADAEVEQ